ncbi:MAG: hypothetical protein AB2L14_27380 [Candidatus Xenobiia bacterium LiM19]
MMATTVTEKIDISAHNEDFAMEDIHTSVNVKLFPAMVTTLDVEMERYKFYASSVFNDMEDAEDAYRFAREGLSKKVTREVLQSLLEDQENGERSGFYYLLDPYGLICGTARMNSDGSLQKDDSITLRKSTVKVIKSITKREILEGLKHELADLMQARLDRIGR